MSSDDRFTSYPSEVVLIRLAPADVMACVDACNKAGIVTNGMSLALMVRVAVSCMCETLRSEGVLPVRDAFEYAHMTDGFKRTNRKKKIQIAKGTTAGIKMRMMHDMSATPGIAGGLQPTHASPQSMPLAMKNLLREIKEMTAKKELGDANYQMGSPGYNEREHLIDTFIEQGGSMDDIMS